MGQLILGFRKGMKMPACLERLHQYLVTHHTGEEVREMLAKTGNLEQYLQPQPAHTMHTQEEIRRLEREILYNTPYDNWSTGGAPRRR
jgi:hypothetical protein